MVFENVIATGSFSVPLLGLARRESQYCSYSGYKRRPKIKESTELSVSFISFHVSSSSVIVQSIYPLGLSMKQSIDVCRAAIIFLIVILPHTPASKSLYQLQISINGHLVFEYLKKFITRI